MKKRTEILIILGTAFAIPLIAGGGMYLWGLHEQKAAEPDAARQDEIVQGKAVTWVMDKYGFTPEVVDVDPDRGITPPDSDHTEAAVVWLSDGFDNFRVLVSEDDTHTCDDYQQQAVTEALLQEVNSILPGGEVICFRFVNADCGSTFLRERYTGDNLPEILSELTQLQLQIGYVNTDFADVPDFPLLREYQIFTDLYSFDSAEHRADALRTELYFRGENWAPMLTGGCFVRPDGSEPFTYNVFDHGDFLTMYKDAPEAAAPVVTETDADVLIGRFRREYPDTELPAGTVQGWEIVTDSKAFYFYYPVHDEIPVMYRVEAVTEEENADESTVLRNRDMYVHGDYYVLECDSAAVSRIAVIEDT